MATILSSDDLDIKVSETTQAVRGAAALSEQLGRIKDMNISQITPVEREYRDKVRREMRNKYEDASKALESSADADDKRIYDHLVKNQGDSKDPESKVRWLGVSAVAMGDRERNNQLKIQAIDNIASAISGGADVSAKIKELQDLAERKKGHVEEYLKMHAQAKQLITSAGADWKDAYEASAKLNQTMSEMLSKDPDLREAVAATQVLADLGSDVSAIDETKLKAAKTNYQTDSDKVKAWIGSDNSSASKKIKITINGQEIVVGGYIGMRMASIIASVKDEEIIQRKSKDQPLGALPIPEKNKLELSIDNIIGQGLEVYNGGATHRASTIFSFGEKFRPIDGGLHFKPDIKGYRAEAGDNQGAIHVKNPSGLLLSMVGPMDNSGERKKINFTTSEPFKLDIGATSIYRFGKVRLDQNLFKNKNQLNQMLKKQVEDFLDSEEDYLPVMYVTQEWNGLRANVGYLSKDAVRLALGR